MNSSQQHIRYSTPVRSTNALFRFLLANGRSRHTCYCKFAKRKFCRVRSSDYRERSTRRAAEYDVIALGNLCVDVVIPVEQLPPVEEVKKEAVLEKLTAEAAGGDQKNWEAGAQSNFMIAAARLGLRVASAANVGKDVYGDFLCKVLLREGVQKVEPLAPKSFEEKLNYTLICFVLVDSSGKHHFCSRYDFGPWPLLPGIESLPEPVLKADVQLLNSTRALFVNGFIFDELPGNVVMAAVNSARRAGAGIFFDPGPRAWALRQGERRQTLEALLNASDVILMTQEEAEAVTGLADPEAAAVAVLERPGALTQWCAVKMGPQGALIRTKHPPQTLRHPAVQVAVVDTVGCGDSFAAAVVLGFIQQRPLAAVLALSNAVGAATATASGAGRNVATAEAVRQLLRQQVDGSPPPGLAHDYSQWADVIADYEISPPLRESSIIAASRKQGLSASRLEVSRTAAQALQVLDETLLEAQNRT